MWSLLRNPLISFLLRLWWLPALVLTFGISKPYGTTIAQYFSFMIAACVAGILLSALSVGIWKRWQLRRERQTFEYRFLCPGCLNFGQFDYACEKCGSRVESHMVDTGGAFVRKCGHCRHTLFTNEDTEGRPIKAHCNNCDVLSDREIHHNRAVRVFATLTSGDFDAFSENTGAEIKKSRDGMNYLIRDDGSTLTFVLNLETLNLAVTSGLMKHALRDISFIWIDCSDVDPLELGQTVDAMIMRTDVPEKQWRSVTVCISQPHIDTASRHVLETRFGSVRCGISLDDFTEGYTHKLGGTGSEPMTAVRF